MKLSIIIPAHNEQENIEDAIRKIEAQIKIEHELVIVNDHSQDNTLAMVEDLRKEFANLRLVENRLEKGFANAIKTGFNNARGDLVIPVMADLCDDLLTIGCMLDKMSKGFDVVCGARYIRGGARLGGPKIKAFFSCFTGWSLRFLLGMPTHDVANAFKMYRKKVIDSIDIQAKSFEISMELVLKAYYAGFKICEVPTVWRERTKGKSNFKAFKLFPNYFKFYSWAIWERLRPKRCHQNYQ
jgi:glycosyltransferase involved in cell wall biosynthesis